MFYVTLHDPYFINVNKVIKIICRLKNTGKLEFDILLVNSVNTVKRYMDMIR